MKEQEELSHFIKAQKMGIEIFRLFRDKTNDIGITTEIEDTIKRYETRLDELLQAYRKNYAAEVPEMTFWQKRAIGMTRMKLMCIKTDRKLVRFIAKNIAMGTTGALKFLEKVDSHNVERVSLLKNTVADFIETYAKFSRLLLVD